MPLERYQLGCRHLRKIHERRHRQIERAFSIFQRAISLSGVSRHHSGVKWLSGQGQYLWAGNLIPQASHQNTVNSKMNDLHRFSASS